MALIILDPNESFEHYHIHDSFTQHVNGSIQVKFGTEEFILAEGNIVKIPAHTSHILTNVGQTNATFKCYNHQADPDTGPNENPHLQ